MPVASNDSPGTPSVFAFERPLHAMANPNSSPTLIKRGPAVGGTASPSTINGRHQHSGSLQFPMTSAMTWYEGNGAAARQPYLQSMSLPNRGMTRLPVSPGGESLRSEGDSEFDDEWSGAAGQPRPPRAIQMYGSPRHGSSSGARLPKNHICHLCGKAFNRPSSLNTHMAVHTGAKPFQCPKRDCGRKFSVSSNLRRHMKTHTVNEQARVAQLTARDLAAQSHFEVNPEVKLEPEDHPADDILEEEERELENGSIVYDDNGRAYRYYTSESAYQEATAGNLAETPTQDRANQCTGQQQQHQTSPGSLSIDEIYNQDSPFVTMQLQSSLGNAAPVSFSPSIPAESRNGTYQELAAPFEQWMPGNPALHISAGASLQQPLILGYAGAPGN
ncbi:hypothetical protein QFC21_002266 [Naganishia friedmannii]|uniref:Uncharacterized protein n=1 Tax=Naganishia friedmannii TaxID=89922 RepID=A0ACC2VXM4_9TREE|nr:hypothetical protein QFC21_002266 [Naganishia friedmannii]